jgi:simple sugar transport system permease protein
MTVLDDVRATLAHAPSPERTADRARALIPFAALALALVIGAVLILVEGAAPVAVYRTVVEGVVNSRFGWRDTLVEATPLAILGLGLALAYRARVFTIGAEGQYVIGAVAAVAVVTAPALAGLPAAVLVIAGIVVAAVAGALWSALSGLLLDRFGTSVVISSLLLNYVAFAVLAWAVRVGIKDPAAFVPQSRAIGPAALPNTPGLDVHLGVPLAAVLVAIGALVAARTRAGFLVDVHGGNPDALDAHELSKGRLVLAVLVGCGALSGLAGFVQVSGVEQRLTPSSSAGYGFTAIVVAVLGRNRPGGVLLAALALSALAIGFEYAQRDHRLSASVVGVIQALIVLFVVIGDALVTRRRS